MSPSCYSPVLVPPSLTINHHSLTSDMNSALYRPFADLFDFPEYKRTGMLLWPDYWGSTVAPDFFTIAEEAKPWEGARARCGHGCPFVIAPAPACESNNRRPLRRAARLLVLSHSAGSCSQHHCLACAGSVETGQLVVNKKACWLVMQLVLFLNLQGSLYYNLLTNYMGTGDKETFPAAMRMLQQPFAVVVRHLSHTPYPSFSPPPSQLNCCPIPLSPTRTC